MGALLNQRLLESEATNLCDFFASFCKIPRIVNSEQ